MAVAAAACVLACSSQTSQSSAGSSAPANAIPPVQGETRNAQGIRYTEVIAGTGDVAARGRCLYTDYTGWLADGTRIDSSHDLQPDGKPGEPAVFRLGAGAVMPGWEVGFSGMRVGGKRRLFIPYQQAYGERGRPPLVPPRTALVFDVELVAVMDATGASCPALRR
jgi:peptidylprolyl isomerase